MEPAQILRADNLLITVRTGDIPPKREEIPGTSDELDANGGLQGLGVAGLASGSSSSSDIGSTLIYREKL